MKKFCFAKLRDYIPQLFCIILTLGVIFYAFVSHAKYPTDYPVEQSHIFEFHETALQVESNSVVTLPYYPNGEAGETYTISTTLPADLQDNMVLCLRPDQLNIQVYVDGQLRLTYDTTPYRVFGKVSPRRYIYMRVNTADAGKEMRIVSEVNVSGAGSINILTYGDKYDVVGTLAKGSLNDISIACIMLVICILCLVGGIILSIGLKSFVEVTYLAIMGIFASIWILCNAEISQIYFPNNSLTLNVDYFMLMLLPFPFLFFMNDVQKKKYNAVYKIFEYMVAIESFLTVALFVTEKMDLSQLFLAIAGAFGSSLIMILVTIFIDVFKCKNYNYIIIAFGILAGILATLVQFGLFMAGAISFGGTAVAVALLIILLTAVIDTFRKVRSMERDKQMAIAQGKAESSFLANMSHEIRTPINAVLGLNEMVLRESGEPEIQAYAKDIDNSGKMLLSIVNDILDLSKIRSGKMKIIPDNYSLNTAIKNVCDMISVKAGEKKLEFALEMNEDIPNDLYGDEIRIKQVMVNILNNAVKYTDKGKVTFRVGFCSTGEDSMILHFEVSDTGRGIKQEDIGSLFDAFSRVDEKNNKAIEGTGLGLALVQNLVSSMEGTIRVESVYGEGSTFIVDIPQKKVGDRLVKDAREAAPKVAAKAGGEALFQAPTAKILVVDDVKVNLTVVTSLLKRTGVQVTAVLSGAECLENLRKDSFDVVLLDHLMPQMDGVETLAKIREENLAGTAAVVALTANAISGAREEYLSYGFDDYLTKPVKGVDLENLLLKYIPAEKVESGKQ